ncbi:uncharacterized protein ACRADG_005922 [Cochliomyia hominivorax]
MHDYYIKNNKQLFWNRNMIATFIENFKEYECLYNRQHPDYKNQIVKSDALQMILHKLQAFLPNLQLKDVQEKLKAIYKQFATEVSLVDEAEALGHTYEPKLWCYNQLNFLRQYIDSTRKEDNASNNKITDSEEASVNDSSDISDDPKSSKSQPDYRWEQRDTKIFITLLKKFNILYDSQNEHYNNSKLKYRACIALTKEAQKIDPKINFQSVKFKIRTLRNQYLAELRRIRKAKENNKIYTPRLWSFDLLKSLYKHDLETKTTDSVSSNETTKQNEFDEIINSNEQINNETYEIEPIHQVIIQNEMEYNDETPDTYATETNQIVVDYECEDTFDYVPNDFEDGDYKEESDKDETDFIVEEKEERIEVLQEEDDKKLAEVNESLNKNEIVKYGWLGDLVTSQLQLISSRYHDQLTTDIENLIEKYKERSKSNEYNSKQSNDTFLQDNSNVSFNLRIV